MILRILALISIVANIGLMGAWFALNPPATYERLADRDLRAAHDAFRKVSPEKSYAMYHRVQREFARSTFADEARFYAARTAFLGMGRFEEAEKELETYIKSEKATEEHKKDAESYLELIRNRGDIAAEARDEVLWEYVQATMEESNGRWKQAATRLEWIVEAYGSSGLGRRAAEAHARVAKRLAAEG